jgi:hypothetical protein
MELDSFLTEQNVTRYRKSLDSSTVETERRTIIELLAEEKAKLKGEHLPNKFPRASHVRCLQRWPELSSLGYLTRDRSQPDA